MISSVPKPHLHIHIYYEGTLLEPSLVSVLSISYAICDFFAQRTDFLKEIRRRRSGRRRFSSLVSLWFRLLMLRRLLWCGRRDRVSSNHLYERAMESGVCGERSGCTFFVSPSRQRPCPLSRSVLLCAPFERFTNSYKHQSIFFPEGTLE